MKMESLRYLLLLTFSSLAGFSQARKELNFGLIGLNYEIPVHKDVTIAPGIATNFDVNWITLHVKGSYYFDNLFEISDDAWDVYGGVGAGFASYNGDKKDRLSDGLNLGLHFGGRWFWNDKWGIYLELGSGTTTGALGGLGLTVKL